MKINTGKISGKIRVRITRPWRGYPVGTIITPPAGLRQILLQTNDQLGHSVAEVVAEDVAAPTAAGTEFSVSDSVPATFNQEGFEALAYSSVGEVVAKDSQPEKQSKKQNKHK